MGDTPPVVGAVPVLQPLATVARGLGRLAIALHRRWATTDAHARGPYLLLAAGSALLVWALPYGPVGAAAAVLVAAVLADRRHPADDRRRQSAVESERRLRSLYDALTPHFAVPDDPSPLYTPGGDHGAVLTDAVQDADGRLTGLRIAYPAAFHDSDPDARARIEAILHTKTGRTREILFTWHEEENVLDLAALADPPADIHAQRFITAPGEIVLGFTDPCATRRTLPVITPEGPRQVPPVIWRTGPHAPAPHLLVLGRPGAGTTNLLRAVALQALAHGDVLVADGQPTPQYGHLAGHPGVLAVEHTLTGILAALTWAADETRRRLTTPGPHRPLWLLIDQPAALTHLADSRHRPDPQALLDTPLIHGPATHVTVAVAEHTGSAPGLSRTVRDHTPARVVLGPHPTAHLTAVLGAPPPATPPPHYPAGRGYAQVAAGATAYRLHTPYTPHPDHCDTPADLRQELRDLHPRRTTPA